MSDVSDGIPHVTTDPRRERIRVVIRDFFRDKPPGTTIEQDELDTYYLRLHEAAKELP